jgi:hypothetical protein
MSRGEKGVAEAIRGVVALQMGYAEQDLEAALSARAHLGKDATQEDRELADTRIVIARDRIAELQTELIEADIIETETAVRAFEKDGFAAGARYLHAAAGVAERAGALLHELRQAHEDPARTDEEVEKLMRELDAIERLLDEMADGMEGVADNTEANADKERALKPETIPGGKLGPTVPRPSGGSPGEGEGEGEGGQGGGGAGGGGPIIINRNNNFNNNNAQGGAGGMGMGGAGGAGGAGGNATATASTQNRRRRVGDIMLAIRVTAPLGDVNEGDAVGITWTTEGGTAPRNVTIELFAPQTSQLHPADFHPIVQGARDVGTFGWTAQVPQGHYTGLTISSPQNPVSLPGFYIRVTVTDASGQSASDTTPTFAIIRR